MYAHIDKIVSPSEIIVKYIYGFDFLTIDTDVEMVDPFSYITYGVNYIVDIERLNNQ